MTKEEEIEARVIIEQRSEPPEAGPKICSCGERKVNWVVDPYDEDINGRNLWQYMCAKCEYESGREI